MRMKYTCTAVLLTALMLQLDGNSTIMQSWPGLPLGGVGTMFLCKTCSVLCVLVQLRVENSSAGPLSVGPNWLKARPDPGHDQLFNVITVFDFASSK